MDRTIHISGLFLFCGPAPETDQWKIHGKGCEMAASTASQIIEAIGGAGNVKSLTHCATRLRFELVDAGKVDQHRLETMKGVLGAVPQCR